MWTESYQVKGRQKTRTDRRRASGNCGRKKVAEHVGSEKCRRVARQHFGRAAAVRSQMSSLSGVTQSSLIAEQYCYLKRSAAAVGGEYYYNYYCHTHAFVCERQRPSVPLVGAMRRRKNIDNKYLGTYRKLGRQKWRRVDSGDIDR